MKGECLEPPSSDQFRAATSDHLAVDPSPPIFALVLALQSQMALEELARGAQEFKIVPSWRWIAQHITSVACCGERPFGIVKFTSIAAKAAKILFQGCGQICERAVPFDPAGSNEGHTSEY